jgi:hypothetical protein
MENYKQWMEQKLTSEDMDKLPKVIKPLNEEQIEYILNEELKWNVDNIEHFVKLVRAIETAHNIK